MFRGEPKETNYPINKGPEHCSIEIHLPRCEPAYLDVVVEISFVPNLDRLKSAHEPLLRNPLHLYLQIQTNPILIVGFHIAATFIQLSARGAAWLKY